MFLNLLLDSYAIISKTLQPLFLQTDNDSYVVLEKKVLAHSVLQTYCNDVLKHFQTKKTTLPRNK